MARISLNKEIWRYNFHPLLLSLSGLFNFSRLEIIFSWDSLWGISAKCIWRVCSIHPNYSFPAPRITFSYVLWEKYIKKLMCPACSRSNIIIFFGVMVTISSFHQVLNMYHSCNSIWFLFLQHKSPEPLLLLYQLNLYINTE